MPELQRSKITPKTTGIKAVPEKSLAIYPHIPKRINVQLFKRLMFVGFIFDFLN